MHYEQKTASGGYVRVSGDVRAVRDSSTVIIPFASLAQWTDAMLTDYGLRRVADPAPTPTPALTNSVPDKISNFQARAALLGAGLFDAVDQWAKALGSNHPGFQAWEYANDFYRHGQLLNEMAAKFNMNQQTLDDLFTAGSKIDP